MSALASPRSRQPRFLSVIDGAMSIESAETKGHLELYYVNRAERRLLNDADLSASKRIGLRRSVWREGIQRRQETARISPGAVVIGLQHSGSDIVRFRDWFLRIDSLDLPCGSSSAGSFNRISAKSASRVIQTARRQGNVSGPHRPAGWMPASARSSAVVVMGRPTMLVWQPWTRVTKGSGSWMP